MSLKHNRQYDTLDTFEVKDGLTKTQANYLVDNLELLVERYNENNEQI